MSLFGRPNKLWLVWRKHAHTRQRGGTKETIQPYLTHLHVVSLVGRHTHLHPYPLGLDRPELLSLSWKTPRSMSVPSKRNHRSGGTSWLRML